MAIFGEPLKRGARGLSLFALLAVAACGDAQWSTTESVGPESGDLKPKAEQDVPANVGGSWTETSPWPFLAIHAALTPDGRVLTYGGNGGGQGGHLEYDIWDPDVANQQNAHLTLPNTTNVDTFCSAGLLMPQSGNVVLASGDRRGRPYGDNDRNRDLVAFNAGSNGLQKLSRGLNHQRWYGTMTLMPSGDLLMQGGVCWGGNAEQCDGSYDATTPEIYRAGKGWQPLSGARSDDVFGRNQSRWWYPRSWVAPDGRAFGVTAGTDMYFIDTRGGGSIERVGQLDSRNYGATNSAVMYRPGKILMTGGGGTDSNGREPNGSTAATIIDIGTGNPLVSAAAPMSQGRQWHTATVLPNGQVLVTGGSTRNNTLEGVTYHAEIWDPDTDQWTVGNRSDTPRLYHSVAILLPDGRVLTGGGGAPGPGPYVSAEVYSPPYLFDANGGLAARPVISTAPGQIDWGGSFAMTMQSDETIERITLVGAGAVTHSVNMGQRFVELDFTQIGSSLNVAGPGNPNDVPPGFYMLFAINDAGVPARAKMIRVINAQISPSPDQEVEANLIHNGSFEANSTETVLPVGGYMTGRWPGWRNLATSGVEVWRQHRGYRAIDGEHWMELDVNGQSSDQIYQDVTTLAGQSYELSMFISARPGTSGISNAMEVWWNGVPVKSLAPDGTGITQPQWTQISVNVTGTGRDRLLFKEVGTDEGTGALIDNVRLVARASTVPPASGNLVANGSFETSGAVTISDGGYRVTNQWPNWRNLSNRGVEVWRNHRGYAAADGEHWIELDAYGNSVDEVIQDVATVAGQRYKLSLMIAPRPGTPLSSNGLQVQWNGTGLQSISLDGAGIAQAQWQRIEFDVTGTGQDRIALKETGTDDGLGMLIDEVSLIAQTAAPPPPTGNLVLNGGFESPGVAGAISDGGYTITSRWEGWNNRSNRGVEVWRNHRGYTGAQGEYWIELDAYGNSPDEVFQDVTTQAGQRYQLSLAVSPRPGTTANSNAMQIWWNGTQLQSVMPDGEGLTQLQWRRIELLVTGTGQDQIRLLESGTDDGLGPLIDDIQLLPLP